MKILPSKPHFSPESIEYILEHFREILEGKSFLSSFKYCEELEQKFAAYHGVKYGVTCSSGTTALELCLRGLNITNREVIVPSVTFAATAFAVLSSGNIPVFAETADDLTVDPDDVERLITPNTAAVFTVHIGGRVSPRTRQLQDICRDKGIPLLEDAAHAHGSSLGSQPAGSFGAAAAFSFFSTKVMTTGEGGIVLTDDETVRDRALLIRNYAKKNNQNYHEEYGSSWRLTEVQALMGITQLRELDAFIQRRRELALIFDQGFAEEPQLQTIPAPEECGQNFYKYFLLLPHGVDRGEFSKYLKENYQVTLGGPTYETPLHEQPVFRKYATRRLPKASDLCRRHICPPMYYTMTDEEAWHVVKSVRQTLQHFLAQPRLASANTMRLTPGRGSCGEKLAAQSATVYLTGGSGFIGSAVARALEVAGVRCVVLDQTEPNEASAEYLPVDVTDLEQCCEALSGAQYIVHLAGLVAGPANSNPYLANAINVQGTNNILEACKRQGVKRLVYASTFFVFEDCALESVTEETPLDITRMGPFARSKYICEQLANDYLKKHKLSSAGLRFGSVYGEGKGSNVINDFIAQAIRGEEIVIWGEGKRHRQFIHVDDIAAAVISALESEATGPFNIAGEAQTTTRQVLEIIQRQLTRMKYSFDSTKPEKVQPYYMQLERAQQELGWEPTIGIEEGIDRTIAWMAKASFAQAAKEAAVSAAAAPASRDGSLAAGASK